MNDTLTPKQKLRIPINSPFNDAVYTHERKTPKVNILYGEMEYRGRGKGPCEITKDGLERLIRRFEMINKNK